MSDDTVRNHLVTVFICAKCGTSLNLSYNVPPRHEHTAHDITGAYMVEKKVAIHPCKTCCEGPKAALQSIRDALGVRP